MDDLQVGGRCSIPQAFSAATTHNVPVLSLRYWSSRSDFVSKAQQLLDARLPERTLAREISPPGACAGSMLAWRSPTETVLIARKGEVGTVLDELPPCSDGYALDMTGAFSLVTCCGPQIASVFARLGGPGTLPGVGEAKRGRLAEVPGLAICVREGECHILVEHYYGHHLNEWIRQAAAHLI